MPGDFVDARTPGIDSAAFEADDARRMPNELY
jgi:hypothetical protein